MTGNNKRLADELALATQQLSAVVGTITSATKLRSLEDQDSDDWSSTPTSSASSEDIAGAMSASQRGQEDVTPVVVSALARVSGKLRTRREESQLLKTTGGVDERQKTIDKFRSSRMPIDIFRLRRECLSGNSIAELISDYKSMQKGAHDQADRDYVQTNVRYAAKVKTSECLRRLRKAAMARDARFNQALQKHKELEKEKAQIRTLSLSRDPVARQTVAAYRAIPVSVVSSSQAAASPLLNQDPSRRWSSVLVAATFAARLGGAAESLVLKRKRDQAWRRLHSASITVCCAVHWRHRTRRAKEAINSWMFAVRCMRLLRKHWRRRREQRSAEMVKVLVMNALNAGKARFAIRRFLHSTRRIQNAWRDYLRMQEEVIRRWNKSFLDREYKYLTSIFKEHKEGRALETKDMSLQEIIKKSNGERATRVLSIEEDNDSEPSTPRNPFIGNLHPLLPVVAPAGGRRRAAIRVDAAAGMMHEWAIAQTHRQVESHRLKEATRFAILSAEFHNRMRARADARKTLVASFSGYVLRIKEFYDFLAFFGIKPEKADRNSLATIKSQYEQTVNELRKVGALASIKEFPDMMNIVTQAHRNYGTILAIDKPQQIETVEIPVTHEAVVP